MLPSQGTASQVSTMTCTDSEVQKISKELDQLSLKRQQLLERKKIHCLCQELRNRAEFEQTEEAASQQQQQQQQQIDSIDDQLNELTARKAELQNRLDNIGHAKKKNNDKEVSFTISQKIVPEVPAAVSNICIYVEPPPSCPAPAVILDLEKLPPCPSRTQCPECRQFIMTETFSTVSSVTWLVCLMTALIGCLAGCCFIPFCLDRFKTTTHRCPKCRTLLQNIKRL